ncbi:putative immunity protein [Kribbella sp. NPDC051770]|uniref:putative immunity protein n=1 Tax=Kribbella sp. NPDC051770 TaxID=3155413 RepID=UPI0034120906
MADRRVLVGWAAECAVRVVGLVEGDPRVRGAVEAAEGFAAGGERTKRIRDAAWGALAAARESGDPVWTAAARAAGYAAGAAYVHDLVSAHQVKHVLGPAVQMALAEELAAGVPEVGEDAVRWAVEIAPAGVRGMVVELPQATFGKSRVGVLSRLLDQGLRTGPR